MNAEAVRRFLAQPAPGDFDRLARALLESQQETAASSAISSTSEAKVEGAWQATVPALAATLEADATPPSDALTLGAVRQAEWILLKPPAGTPVLLLQLGVNVIGSLGAAVLEASSPGDATHALRGNRIDGLAARSWLGARQRADRPAWIVARADLAAQLVQDLERRRLRFRVPQGSRFLLSLAYHQLVEECVPLRRAVAAALGIPAASCSYLVCVPTLSSRIRVDSDDHGNLTLAPAPPWMRYRLIADSRMSPRGLAVLDLATTAMPPFQLLDWQVSEQAGGLRLESVV